MFKNNIINVNTVQWIKSAAIRAIKTMAQAAIAIIGTGSVMGDVNWVVVASSAGVAGILSVLNSLVGIPEVTTGETTDGK